MYANMIFQALFASYALALTAPQDSNCKEVNFTLSGKANNKDITNIALNGTLDSIVDFYKNAPSITTSGPQTIKGTFCSPTRRNSNKDKLQVLFHSITATRSAWSALGGVGSDYPAYKPEMYSWVRYANAQGYPTLAIDRLGNGRSSHPDPVLVVQAPYE